MSKIKKYKSILLSLTGSICLSAGALLVESMALTGISGTLGFLLLIYGGRRAHNRTDIMINGVLLWLGHALRFSGDFGGDIPFALCVGMAFIPYCALLAAALIPDRFLQRSGHPFLATLVMPVTYALCAFLLAALNFGLVVNIMASLMCIPVIAVNLSYLGEYIMTFILMWILVCIPEIWSQPGKKMRVACSAVTVILPIILIICGIILRSQWGEPDYTLKVAMSTCYEESFTGEDTVYYTKEQQLEMFASHMEQAAAQDAELLILNEEYFGWKEEDTEEMLDSISQIVSSSGIPALVGIYVKCSDETAVNEAVYFDGDGLALYTYVKNNLVPFMEDECVDGEEEPAVLQTSIGGHDINLAYIICYDVNDEDYLRTIPSSTELLLVPSWEWDSANLEQRRTVIRSATLGLTMVKHSYDGISYVSCPDGDVAEEVDFRGCYDAVRTITVSIWEK